MRLDDMLLELARRGALRRAKFRDWDARFLAGEDVPYADDGDRLALAIPVSAEQEKILNRIMKENRDV